VNPTGRCTHGDDVNRERAALLPNLRSSIAVHSVALVPAHHDSQAFVVHMVPFNPLALSRSLEGLQAYRLHCAYITKCVYFLAGSLIKGITRWTM